MTCPNEDCGEQLWQWTSQPDRWPIAKYAQRRMRGFFDYFVVDEVHQAKGEDTAIATNMSRFVAASRKVIALTGTLLGGYAHHLRTLLYRLSPGSLDRGRFGLQRNVQVQRAVRADRNDHHRTWCGRAWTGGSTTRKAKASKAAREWSRACDLASCRRCSAST